MPLLDFLATASAAWAILACLGGFSWAFAATRLKLRNRRTADVVNWMPVLPPVPPARYEINDDWLALLPVDVLSDDEVTRRFNQMRAEGAL